MVSPYCTLSRWFPKTLACAHPQTIGSREPFLNDKMVSLYCTHSRGFMKACPGSSKSFGEPPSDERFPHTIPQRGNGFLIQSQNGSRKLFPGLLKVSVHHRKKNCTITPFLNEAMVSSYHTMSKLFWQTLSWPAKGVCEALKEERFPYTIV